MKRYKLKKKPVICLILFLILISNTFILSKYSSGINAVSPEKKVAKFDVSINTTDNASDTLTMLSGTTEATYIVKVVSRSDISANYSIVLSNVPNGLQVSLDNGTYQTPVNSTITFAGVNCTGCSFTANDSITEHTHTLKFYDLLNSNNTGNKSVNIDVMFSQVD